MSKFTALTVGISGGSAAGKTTVAGELARKLAVFKPALLEVDRYFKDHSGKNHEELAKINYDVPEALDFHLLERDLRLLRSGEAVLAPEYDYATHSSRPMAYRIEPSRLIIVEGILLFHPANIAPLMDFKIFVEAAREERLRRRIERDTVQRGRTRESVIRQFNETVEPAYLQYTLPTKALAAAVLDWNAVNHPALDHIVGRIGALMV